MQRVNKYRGICIDENTINSGKMVFGYYVKTEENTYIIEVLGENSFIWNQVNPETVGKCTGLSDKNGKEIYEGDIVRFKHEKLIEKEHDEWDLPYDFETKEYHRNYAVEFTSTNTHYGLRFRNKNTWFMVHRMTILTHDAIVIGNIYDNPELLQEVD